MRRDPQEYEESDVELIYIAAKVDEAERVEAILNEQGIDYTIEVDQYRSGVIFASVRAGAFFYVPVESAVRSRQALVQNGFKVVG